MTLDNKEKFKFSNITYFHEKGYYGEGVVVVIQEPESSSNHDIKMIEVVRMIAPKAKIVKLSSSASLEEIEIVKPDLINRSFGYRERPSEDFLGKYYPKEEFKYIAETIGATLITSAGNYGEGTL